MLVQSKIVDENGIVFYLDLLYKFFQMITISGDMS